MTDNTPVEMAAEALRPHQGRATARTSYGEHSTPMITLTAEHAARTALAAAVEDREGLVRVLIRHDSDRMTCFNHDGECCPAEDAHDFESRQGHQADAVARWLTGEEA